MDGDASRGCGCGALARPPRPDVTEQHADTCSLLDESRARRDRDLSDLAGRPPGWTVVRPLTDGERVEAEDATGAVVPASPRARRRWHVEVRTTHLAGRPVLVRAFVRDGRLLGAIVDDVPTLAGAR